MEIVHTEDSLDDESTRRFLNLQAKFGSRIAYHGTPLENLHSILRSGFLNHLNTTSLFGPARIPKQKLRRIGPSPMDREREREREREKEREKGKGGSIIYFCKHSMLTFPLVDYRRH